MTNPHPLLNDLDNFFGFPFQFHVLDNKLSSKRKKLESISSFKYHYKNCIYIFISYYSEHFSNLVN